MLQVLNDLDIQVNLNLLLYGNENLALEVNCHVFELVHSFIKSSRRFGILHNIIIHSIYLVVIYSDKYTRNYYLYL